MESAHHRDWRAACSGREPPLITTDDSPREVDGGAPRDLALRPSRRQGRRQSVDRGRTSRMDCRRQGSLRLHRLGAGFRSCPPEDPAHRASRRHEALAVARPRRTGRALWRRVARVLDCLVREFCAPAGLPERRSKSTSNNFAKVRWSGLSTRRLDRV